MAFARIRDAVIWLSLIWAPVALGESVVQVPDGVKSALARAITPIPDAVKPAVADKQVASEPNQVRFTGLLGVRAARNETNRLLAVDEHLMLEGFQQRPGKQEWVGEHVGKWLHAATLAWVYTGDDKLREKIDRVTKQLIKCQDKDGYLGTYLPKAHWTSWDVWVHKYDLIGLLTFHRYRGESEALASARRIGDLLCNTFGRDKRNIVKAGEHAGMAATSVLEPMVLLYRLTGDRKYLDFCDYILWAWDQPRGPRVLTSLSSGNGVNKTANGKAYEMLSNLVGLCELYRTTGDPKLLTPALNAWQDIVDKRLYLTGSASQKECFHDDFFLPNDPSAAVAENCVTVTWVQLNLQLLRLTGEPRFADQLERTIYNHLLSAQKPTGEEWTYFTALEGIKEYGHMGRPMHCCLSSGPRAISLIPTFAYATDADGIVVNFYEPGTADLRLADGSKLRVEQETQYPGDGLVRLVLHLEKPAKFAVRLRVPAWCLRYEIDGQETTREKGRPAYETITRDWKDGAEVRLRLDLPFRVIKGDHGNAGRVALMHGPLVLAADEAWNPQAKPPVNVSLPSTDPQALNFRVLPAPPDKADWKGQRIYEVTACFSPQSRPAGQGEGSPVTLTLVPFAECGRGGAKYQVWLNTAPAGCSK